MIIDTKLHTVDSCGVLEKTSFSMANNAHAFSTMSDRLYSDKVTAVIREVVINAVDAHIEVGTPERPVEIHLPTALEPFFHVKDFGPGLSHEDMMHLYTTYFASTKTSENTNTGGFGLGCKAPFAYTSTFSVESTHRGITRVYSALKGEDGKPEMNLLMEEDNGSPDGILVSLPVRSWDHAEFHRKAAKVLELVPEFTTNLDAFKAFRTVYASVGHLWGIRDIKVDQHIGHARPRAIMGKVAYPINMDESKLTEEQRSILKLPIDLIFEIGDISVTPSRESLDMRKATVDAIIARLDSIHGAIIESVREEINSAKSVWFAKLALRDRLVEGNAYRPIIKYAVKSYFGKYSSFLLDGLTTDLDLRKYPSLSLASRRFTTRNNKLTKLIHEEDRRSTLIETSEAVTFYLHNNSEQPSRVSKRIVTMLQDRNPHKNVTLYLIIPGIDADIAQVTKDFTDLAVALGDPDIYRTSDLPPAIRKPRCVTPSDTCNYAWEYLGGRFSSADSLNRWAKVPKNEFEGDGPFLYVPIERLECRVLGLDKTSMHSIWRGMKTLGVALGDEIVIDASSKLYGLNAVGVGKILNNPSWVNIFELLRGETFDVPKSYLQYKAALSLSQSTAGYPRVFKDYLDSKLKSPLRQYVKGTYFHKQAVMVRRVIQLITRMRIPTTSNLAWAHILGFTNQPVDTTNAMPMVVKTFMSAIKPSVFSSRYPMLSIIASHIYDVEIRTLTIIIGSYIANQDDLLD